MSNKYQKGTYDLDGNYIAFEMNDFICDLDNGGDRNSSMFKKRKVSIKQF